MKYRHWAKKNIFYIEPQFPCGNCKSLLFMEECFGVLFKKIYDKTKAEKHGIGGFYMFAQPNVVIVDPEIIKLIMTKDFRYFPDTGIHLDPKSDPIGAHLLALKGAEWKAMRTKLTPAFTSGKIKMMFPTILNTVLQLEPLIDKHIQQKESLDSKDLFARMSIDVIGTCAFGIDCNSLKDSNAEFKKYGLKVFSYEFRDIIINFFISNFPNVLRFLGIPMNAPDTVAFFMNMVRQTVDYREKNNIRRNDFLDILIRLKNNISISENPSDNTTPTEGITIEELAAQVFVFFAAGFETTSSTLNYCIYELVSNLDIQDKLREEVLDVLQKHNGEITYEAIMEMKYMDKVINETLRKYPPIPMVRRECVKDYKIPNTDYVISKGDIIVLCILGLHRDPDYFPEPDKFDPERFNEKRKKDIAPFTYLPFGEGPRSCIALRFGLTEAKIVLTILLRKYKFTLDSKTITPVTFNPGSIFLSPEHTFWIQAEKLKLD